jgi:BolA protein
VSEKGRHRDAAPAMSGTDTAATLRQRLGALAPAVLEVRDDSAAHAGHAGAAAGGGHFSLLIVSDAFAGLPLLQRHQRVLREVADLLPNPVHALSIKALTPEELPSQP